MDLYDWNGNKFFVTLILLKHMAAKKNGKVS